MRRDRYAERDPIVVELAAERARLGLPLRVIRAMGGPADSSVCKYESGHHEPNLSHLRTWAATLGYDVVLRRKP